jgi:hypothetical protein
MLAPNAPFDTLDEDAQGSKSQWDLPASELRQAAVTSPPPLTDHLSSHALLLLPNLEQSPVQEREPALLPPPRTAMQSASTSPVKTFERN